MSQESVPGQRDSNSNAKRAVEPMALLRQIELSQGVRLLVGVLGIGYHHKDDVLHNDKDIDAAGIVLDVLSGIPGTIFVHE